MTNVYIFEKFISPVYLYIVNSSSIYGRNAPSVILPICKKQLAIYVMLTPLFSVFIVTRLSQEILSYMKKKRRIEHTHPPLVMKILPQCPLDPICVHIWINFTVRFVINGLLGVDFLSWSRCSLLQPLGCVVKSYEINWMIDRFIEFEIYTCTNLLILRIWKSTHLFL